PRVNIVPATGRPSPAPDHRQVKSGQPGQPLGPSAAGFCGWVLAEYPAAPGRRPAPAPHPRKATKTARFLDLVTERHGSLASVPLDATAQIAAALAPLADLNPGACPRWLPRPPGMSLITPPS